MNFEPLTLAVAKRLYINGQKLLPQRPLDVAEFGCASGMFAEYYLTSRIPIKSATLLDISDEMVKRATNRLQTVKTSATYNISRSNEEVLMSLKDHSVDVVFANLLLNVVESPSEFLVLFKRILRTDGLVACSTNSNVAIDSLFDFWDECMAQVNQDVYLKHRFKYQLGDDMEARNTFKANGFDVAMASMDKVRFPWSAVTVDKIWNEPMNQASLRLLTDTEKEKMKLLLSERLKEDKEKGVQPNLLQNTYWLRLTQKM